MTAGTPAQDDGRPDPRLAAALAADDGTPAARGEVLAALATARVFLALVAQSVTDVAPGPGHVEAASQMSLLSLVSDTGARALPAFLDGHEVQRWRREARPVPVSGPVACGTVLDDGAVALLLEPAGAAVAVSGVALAELAAGRVAVPGSALSTRAARVQLVAGGPPDPALVAALVVALRGEPVLGARLLAGPAGPVLGVVPHAGAGAGAGAGGAGAGAGAGERAGGAGSFQPADLAALAARLQARLGAALPPGGLDVAVVGPSGPGHPVPLTTSSRRRGWRRLLSRSR